MKHDWDSSMYGTRTRDMLIHGRRVCRRCKIQQTKHDKQNWHRVVGYGWWPHAGRCRPIRLKRIEAGIYQTADDRFQVWQEPCIASDYPRRWFVNELDENGKDKHGETLTGSGFGTKGEAVEWLRLHVNNEKSTA